MENVWPCELGLSTTKNCIMSFPNKKSIFTKKQEELHTGITSNKGDLAHR